MLDREYTRTMRLLEGRTLIIRTRYTLDRQTGRLVEHVIVQTRDPPPPRARSGKPQGA